MSNIFETETKIKQIIDELKALSAQAGLANQGEEERIITSVFLYKFLNDKFMYNLSKFAEEIGETIEEILKNENDELDAFYDTTSGDVAFGYEDTIQYLINHVEQADFYKQFDDALVRIAQNTRNDIFAVETAEGSYRPLFEAISTPVEPSNRNNFAKNIFGIIAQDKFDFSSAFAGSFDFYSTIFEYLIKDYNVASGVYAEYFTPQSVSSIIARCLVGMSDKVEASEISDPAAGSGSLVLHLAHELGQENGLNRAIVYTQDISSKSTRFLRLNMMLNGMTESLGHIIQGDTLLNPAHFQVEHEPTSGLKKYAYQTANPPFKLDFSSTRDAIEQKWSETDRFFAGVPKIPASKKESMAIYLLFIQHIMYCMKDNGKAAIVVPTGFLTAKSKIEYAIRQRMVDRHIIKGVISMPSQIFANTGTNVSILFLDNANTEEEAFLVDASSLGKKVKDGKNQRTVLSDEEVNRIIDIFTNRKVLLHPDATVCNGKFLMYSLLSPFVQKQIKRSDTTGSVVSNLCIPDLCALEIPYVNIERQECIVALLSDIDSKIDNNNAISAELEGMAKDLYDYWFVQFDFPDENGNPYKSSGGKMVWNEELKREIPEGWEVDRLGKHITSSRGISYNSATLEGDGVPMINLASFGVDSNYKPAGIKTYNGQYDADKILRPFDLIMCNTQQTAVDPTKDIIGKAMLVPDIFDGDVVSSHHITTIAPDVDELKYYIYSTCKTTWFHKYIVGFASGTNILGLDFKGFEDYLMPLPPMRLLQKFATTIKNIESEKSLIITENIELTSLRDFLLPMLMNGQVKVKGRDI